MTAFTSPGVLGAFTDASRRRNASSTRLASTGFVDLEQRGVRLWVDDVLLRCSGGDATCQVFRAPAVSFCCAFGAPVFVGVPGFETVFVSCSIANRVSVVPVRAFGSYVVAIGTALVSPTSIPRGVVVFSMGTACASSVNAFGFFSGHRTRDDKFKFGDRDPPFGDTPPAIVVGDAGYTGWYTRGTCFTRVEGETRVSGVGGKLARDDRGVSTSWTNTDASKISSSMSSSPNAMREEGVRPSANAPNTVQRHEARHRKHTSRAREGVTTR